MSDYPFHETYYYLHRRHESDCEVYTFYTERGVALLAAEVRGFPNDIFFRKPERAGLTLLVLKAWRFFPVNGKYDVLEFDGGTRIGIVHRAGNIYDNAEKVVGHISDPAPLQERVKEGLVEAVADAVLSGGEGQAYRRMPEKLQLQVGREAGGLFQQVRLPFALPGSDKGFSLAKSLQQILPAEVQPALQAFVEPRGWRLDFSMPAAGKIEPQLRVAAALFQIEVERMSGG